MPGPGAESRRGPANRGPSRIQAEKFRYTGLGYWAASSIVLTAKATSKDQEQSESGPPSQFGRPPPQKHQLPPRTKLPAQSLLPRRSSTPPRKGRAPTM